MEHLLEFEERLERIESLLHLQKKVLNLDEVASYTGLSKSHLYKLTSTSGIPCYKPQGKHIYFNREEIEQWLQQNRKATSEEIDRKATNHVTLKSGGGK